MSIWNGPWSSGRRQHGHDDGRVCAELTWGTDGTWLHYGKKVQVGKLVWCFVQHLAGKPWVLSPMWMLLWRVAPTEALLQLMGSCSWTHCHVHDNVILILSKHDNFIVKTWYVGCSWDRAGTMDTSYTIFPNEKWCYLQRVGLILPSA